MLTDQRSQWFMESTFGKSFSDIKSYNKTPPSMTINL